MKNKILCIWLLVLVCTGGYNTAFTQTDSTHHSFEQRIVWRETFDSASKGAYAAAPLSLPSGNWLFDDALTGNSASDHKHGNKAVRIQKSGSITMLFDVAGGISEVSVSSALFGNDHNATWELQYSTDAGINWINAGGEVTTSSDTLAVYNFALNRAGNIRLKIQKTGGGRLNIDDVTIYNNATAILNTNVPNPINNNHTTTQTTYGNSATRDDNMAMGNPSNAANERNNFLIKKEQYTLSYNSYRGGPNWVSWHLSTAWKGNATRCNCFGEDETLPDGLTRVRKADYTNSGFDRGHQCPSDDRDASAEDNTATFLMDNMLPQSPHLNEQTWEHLEAYCRTLSQQGNELYIIAGGYGIGGTGANGNATTIANGKITVPAHCWKVIIILPNGTNDVSRVSTTTRIIAVDMPNTQSVNAHPWGFYRTTTDAIEAATGYDFLSNVPAPLQKVIEAQVDKGPTQ